MDEDNQENIDPGSGEPKFIENKRGTQQLIDYENFAYHIYRMTGTATSF